MLKDKEFINDAKTPEMRDFLEMFVNSQLFEVFISKKLTPGAKFGLMFDEAIRQDQIQNLQNPSSSPKVTTIKQLSNLLCFFKYQIGAFLRIIFFCLHRK